MQFLELDAHTTMGEQMMSKTGPVVLMNTLSIDPADEEQFMRAWTGDAQVMKRQPGFISAQLHRGIAGSGTFMNYAVWETAEAFREAFAHPEFQERLTLYPPSVRVCPHLFERVAVEGICVA